MAGAISLNSRRLRLDRPQAPPHRRLRISVVSLLADDVFSAALAQELLNAAVGGLRAPVAREQRSQSPGALANLASRRRRGPAEDYCQAFALAIASSGAGRSWLLRRLITVMINNGVGCLAHYRGQSHGIFSLGIIRIPTTKPREWSTAAVQFSKTMLKTLRSLGLGGNVQGGAFSPVNFVRLYSPRALASNCQQ